MLRWNKPLLLAGSNHVTSFNQFRAVVVAQLVEWLPPTPDVCGSNPVIGKIYIEHLFIVNCVLKRRK